MSRLTDQTALSALCLIHISGIFLKKKNVVVQCIKCRNYIDNISETHDVVNTSD